MEVEMDKTTLIIKIVMELWHKICPSSSIIDNYKSIIKTQKSVIEDYRYIIDTLKDAYDPKRFVERAKEYEQFVEDVKKLERKKMKKEFEAKKMGSEKRIKWLEKRLETMIRLLAAALIRIRPENRAQVLMIEKLPKEGQKGIKGFLEVLGDRYIPQPLGRGFLAEVLGPGFEEETTVTHLGGIKTERHEKLPPGSGEET